MPNQIQAGTMIVHQSAAWRSLNVESEPYFQQWSSLGPLESSGLDQKVHAIGWNLFFMAGEIRAVVPAWGGHNTLRRGVKRLLAQAQLQNLNCLEVTHLPELYVKLLRELRLVNCIKLTALSGELVVDELGIVPDKIECD